ncbi:TlpA family protein disulfide reductase [Micromonospora globbae]|uniref:TlpA family protein disulfide reductase n=1 Tax=Micromonospora globbae TaxID=1894969 RepID=UPI001F01501D|nr:TlpA disulfide reductase family protein [Micromonospora globbae]
MRRTGVSVRRRHMIAAVGALLTTAVVGCDRASGEDRGGAIVPQTVYPVGKRPAGTQLAGTLLDDSAFDPATLTGKVVVINFWASWCAPCRAEFDDLEAVYQASRDTGVTFLGVNTQNGKDAATAFARGRVTFPSLFDPPGRVALQFREVGLVGLPNTVVLDRQGRIATVFRRAIVKSELEPVVAQLAAEQS